MNDDIVSLTYLTEQTNNILSILKFKALIVNLADKTLKNAQTFNGSEEL